MSLERHKRKGGNAFPAGLGICKGAGVGSAWLAAGKQGTCKHLVSTGNALISNGLTIAAIAAGMVSNAGGGEGVEAGRGRGQIERCIHHGQNL